MMDSLKLTKKDREAFKMLKIIKERLQEMNTVTIDGCKGVSAHVYIQVTFTDKKTGIVRIVEI